MARFGIRVDCKQPRYQDSAGIPDADDYWKSELNLAARTPSLNVDDSCCSSLIDFGLSVWSRMKIIHLGAFTHVWSVRLVSI
jgi:hypothetical protein